MTAAKRDPITTNVDHIYVGNMKSLFVLVLLLCALAVLPASALEYRPAYTGGNCSNCSWIAAEGEITDGDAKKLLDFIRKNGLEYQNLLVINSPGGSVSAALELGTVMRERGMSIIVGRTKDIEPEGAYRKFQYFEAGTCASACVIVLMGGVTREVADENSQVGVHQFAPASDDVGSVAATTSSTQSIVALLQAYAASMGVDKTILVLASTTRPEEMLWLSQKQMEGLNLLTSRKHRQMASWALKPAGSALMAVASQEQPEGQMVNFVVDCHSLLAGIQVRSRRMTDVMKSIDGARITLDGFNVSIPLTIVGKSANESVILITFRGDPTVLDAIMTADDRLRININLPRVYWEEFGVPNFEIPTSNFAEVAPHVLNTCR